LWNKIELLKERTPETNGHAGGTWDAFTAFTGISRETLRDGCPKGEDGVFHYQSITEANEAVLGSKYGFDPTCSTWTSGTAPEFANRWYPELSEPSARRLISVPIGERIRSVDPHGRLFVTLSLRPHDADRGSIFDGELVCQVFTQIGVRLAVRRGVLTVRRRKGPVPPMIARLGGDDGVARFERAANAICARPAGLDHMRWDIEAEGRHSAF
jgi:hypothetical protein